MDKIASIIHQLQLLPHPEGGYYRETYRSPGAIHENALPEPFQGDRNYATSIYFLLTSGNFSAFHRIRQDEIWHFYMGDPVAIHVLTKSGAYERHLLGIDLKRQQVPQLVVQSGDWFASEVLSPGSFSLTGCTVSPGFDFADFEMASRDDLLRDYPGQAELINRLTRS